MTNKSLYFFNYDNLISKKLIYTKEKNYLNKFDYYNPLIPKELLWNRFPLKEKNLIRK